MLLLRLISLAVRQSLGLQNAESPYKQSCASLTLFVIIYISFTVTISIRNLLFSRMATNLRNANKVEVSFWKKTLDEPIADESGVLIDVSFVTWPGKDCYLFRHTPLH